MGDAGPPPTPAAPEVVLGRRALRRTVRRLAAEIDADHPEGVLLVGVLTGSTIFLADLARALTVPVEVDLLALSSFRPDAGRVRIVKDLDVDVGGRHVVVVEDVVDTGLTLGFLVGELHRRGASAVDVCALADKAARRLLPTPLRYRGIEAPDAFLLGYGLDYAGRYRNLDVVVAGSLEVLAADPDAYIDHLYGGHRAAPRPQ